MQNCQTFRELGLVFLGLRHKEEGAVGKEDGDKSRSQSQDSLNAKVGKLDPVLKTTEGQ